MTSSPPSVDSSNMDEQGHFPDFTQDQIAIMHHRSSSSNSSSKNSLDAETALAFSSTKTSKSTSLRRISISFSKKTKSTSRSSTVSSGKRNLWSEMTQIGYMSTEKDVWDDDFEEDSHGDKSKCRLLMEDVKFFYRGVEFEIMHRLKTAVAHPFILVYFLLVFGGLTAISIVMINVICTNMQQSLELDASLEGLQTATWFAEIFAKSLIPLRSLQQAVTYSDKFKALPYKIGNYGAEGSAPSIQGPKSTNPGINDYRNVTGICDNLELIEEFQSLVEGINTNFEFEDVIITYRMAPYGVYCLANPMSVDFGNGNVLNSELEIGLDPIHSESTRMKNMLTDIYHNKNKIHMFGPNNQFLGIDGVHIICGHLAVEMPGYKYQLDGEDKSIWGFVMHFIEWSTLKKKSGIDLFYKEKGYSFQLTRTDMMIDPESGQTSYKDAIIASSKPWPEGHKLFLTNEEPYQESNSVKATVTTEDSGDWTMHVKTHRNFREELWYTPIITTVLSFIVACMVAATLIEKKLNKMLLYKIMPTDAIKKLHRGQTVIERYNIVTIFFSDIVGFTSMCGEMKPIQIMKMLNELYIQFDKLVEKHGVYKVETIGDAYMVVGGAPQRISAPEAAQKVALFSLEAMELVKSFRTTDGDKVIIRAGLASGPVVAGVVGKAMPRYCFFGDTVNLASRMESNSIQLKIQCSDLTYRLLRDAPHYSFNLEKRDELVELKGKGLTQTFWIEGITGGRTTLLTGELDLHFSKTKEVHDPFVQCMALSEQPWTRIGLPDSTLVTATSDNNTMINRLASILEYRLSMALDNPGAISEVVKKEIRAYVSQICTMYNKVNFHSFEHASHVTISMNKLVDCFQKASNDFTSDVEKATSAILRDSSVYFVLVFASLVHDVGHTGMPNKVLEETEHKLYKKNNLSCQEKNSIDIALNLLSRRKHRNMRNMIYYIIDKKSFEKVVHWTILGTDIMCPINNKKIVERYNAIYNSGESTQNRQYNTQNPMDVLFDPIERVAMEHAIQLTDVAHLTQSWETFVKWNYRLYKEFMHLHEKNLLQDDPSVSWAVNQIDFLKHYASSLVHRLNHLFGDVIIDMNLAENIKANLQQWEIEGDRVTSLYVAGYQSNDCERDTLLSCMKE